MRRTSTDSRPVPFSAKFRSVHQSVTGVTVLEHLERLDAVERSLKRLGDNAEDVIEEEDEEVDVGESHSKPLIIPAPPPGDDAFVDATPPEPTPPTGSSSLSTVREHLPMALENSVTEEDMAMMSKSLSHVDGPSSSHARWGSMNINTRQQERSHHLDWMHTPEEHPTRTVIVERLQTVETKPLLSCW